MDGAVENLISVMSQLGMPHDEGPYRDGSNGPYFQVNDYIICQQG